MKSEFSTFGSCASRNLFNSDLNRNYKSYFHINHSVERVNIISLMCEPIDFDEALVNADYEYHNICVIEDLTKRYLDSIRNENFEYILFDTYFDVEFSVIKLDGDSFITDSYSLEHTDLHGRFDGCERLNVFNNFDEYFSLWKKSFDEFFAYLDENSHNIRLILNCSRSAYSFMDGDSIVEDSKLKKQSLSYNKYRNVMDRHIISNYDVEILPFDYATLIDQNHIFGFAPTHYEARFYEEENINLKKIVSINEEFGWDGETNKKIRKLKRENEVLKMDLYDLNNYDIPDLRNENQNLKEKYDSISNSRSWKLTGPLRSFKNSFDR